MVKTSKKDCFSYLQPKKVKKEPVKRTPKTETLSPTKKKKKEEEEKTVWKW